MLAVGLVLLLTGPDLDSGTHPCIARQPWQRCNLPRNFGSESRNVTASVARRPPPFLAPGFVSAASHKSNIGPVGAAGPEPSGRGRLFSDIDKCKLVVRRTETQFCLTLLDAPLSPTESATGVW